MRAGEGSRKRWPGRPSHHADGMQVTVPHHRPVAPAVQPAAGRCAATRIISAAAMTRIRAGPGVPDRGIRVRHAEPEFQVRFRVDRALDPWRSDSDRRRAPSNLCGGGRRRARHQRAVTRRRAGALTRTRRGRARRGLGMGRGRDPGSLYRWSHSEPFSLKGGPAIRPSPTEPGRPR